MFSLIGLGVVFGAVLLGFGLSGGPFPVLLQPYELLVIGGASLGTLIIAAPGKARTRLIATFKKAFKGSAIAPTAFLDALKLQFEVYNFAKRNGVIALEPHLTKLEASDIFKKYPTFLSNHHATDFFKDALAQVVNGTTVDNMEMLLDAELEVLQEEEHQPIALLKATGDALPGLGIVAAVLGIVITMGHLDGGPEEIGHHVAAALVGTFLGILLCYGVVQPLATNVEMQGQSETKYLRCFRDGLLAYMRTFSPPLAVEFARKAIFSDERPSSADTDKALEAVKAAGKSG